jgi:hypothetical protein
MQDDGGAKRIQVFSRHTRAFLRAVPYQGYLSSISRNRDQFVFGLVDEVRGRSAASLPRGSVIGRLPDSAQQPMIADQAPLPVEYKTYNMLRAWSDAKAVQWGDTLLVGFGGLSYLVRYVGGRADTVQVPACGRRGSPANVLDEWFRRVPATRAEKQKIEEHTDNALSALLGLWRLASGRFVVWYQDPVWESQGRILKGDAYLSVIEPDLSRACVDARVGAPGLGRVRIGLQGDTVVVLDQVVSATRGGGRVTSVLRRYLLNLEHCVWLDLHTRTE